MPWTPHNPNVDDKPEDETVDDKKPPRKDKIKPPLPIPSRKPPPLPKRAPEPEQPAVFTASGWQF